MKRTPLVLLALVLGLLAPSAEAMTRQIGTIVSSGAMVTNLTTASPFAITAQANSVDLYLALQCDQATNYVIGNSALGAVTVTTSTGQGIRAGTFYPFQKVAAANDTIAIIPQSGSGSDTCKTFVTTDPHVVEGAAAGSVTGSMSVTNFAGTTTQQSECLVGTSSGTCPATNASGTGAAPLSGRRAIELLNLGPNPIYCKTDGAAVVSLARRILPGDPWSLDVTDAVNIRCIAATAAQVTTAATIITEVK
jgi:hypothetical protein